MALVADPDENETATYAGVLVDVGLDRLVVAVPAGVCDSWACSEVVMVPDASGELGMATIVDFLAPESVQAYPADDRTEEELSAF